jgi:hypothetical protein
VNEAVAELRTLQLSHAPLAPALNRPEVALIPLFLDGWGTPQQESWIEIPVEVDEARGGGQRPAQRLSLVLDTQFLGRVHADISLNGRTLQVSLGVSDAPNRAFVAEHVEALRGALEQTGFQVGSLVTRPAPRASRGHVTNPAWGEAVQFDRRI